jgi:hypothetical protein
MKLKFSGCVCYANGAPVSDVVVRIFDKDAAGKIDDDLTIEPGLSDEQGHFSLTYEPLRYLDFHNIDGSRTPDEPFNTRSGVSERQVPDFGDIYLPYLQFNYTFNGVIRKHTTTKALFQKKFVLPENPPLEFLPSLHGFHFPNRFSGYFLPFSTPQFLHLSKVNRQYGLCGGMCAAAYDFRLSGRNIPGTIEPPHQGTRFHRYLFQRQMDSFGGVGEQLFTVAQWTSLPEDTILGTYARTAEEFKFIRRKLDDLNLVVLALIYAKANGIMELSKCIFNNHQVLAYAYQSEKSGSITMRVYDPNLPGRDDVTIQIELVVVGEMNSNGVPLKVAGMKSTQTLGGSSFMPVRGFFAMPYQPVNPPKGV